IPEQAMKKFSGIIFDTYQWEQTLFDGSIATFEMLKRPSTLQVIPVIGDKILIAYEEQPNKPASYTVLGGRQEPGEESLAGAQREFLEETGMGAKEWTLYKSSQPYTKMDWTIYTYIAKDIQQIQEHTQEAGEKIVIKEVTFSEFIDIATTPEFWAKEITLDIFFHQKKGTLKEFKQQLFHR
ncbi:MAG: hypothetical protein COU30_05510, partial [Candidatus Magasanikbacteria bacterium CG10_big_fil_rev_8_21_14_0_10_38_6]